MCETKFGKTIFEAILKCLPKGYLNTHLSEYLELNSIVVLEVQVQKYIPTSPAKVLCFAPKFDCPLTLSIFHAKPYHRAQFAVDSKLFISGKLQNLGFGLNITQPKILSKTGEIVLQFGKIGAKEKELRTFAKQINIEILKEHYPKIPAKILQSIATIYSPNNEFIIKFAQNRGFFGEYLEAIKFIEIYEYMRLLKSKKTTFKAIAKLQNDNLESWIKTLPFSLTNGQISAICDIRKSLGGEFATRRVIMGDVGCGKTMVILASVIIAYPKKSVLLAPTSVLAKQLYNEAKKFLPPFIETALLTQSTKAKSIKTNALKTCTFLIGTHAILHQNLDDFCLVMIDEQHRFGTAQRSTLEQMLSKDSSHPHILQFSATPIPRTMAMIESNYLDFSFIKDLPFKKDITTKIITNAYFKDLLAHIKSEVKLKHQVLIVYPLVEQSENLNYTSLQEALGFWEREFSGVYSTHGKDKNKEALLEEFAQNGNILLATTVVEVGISLPKLSTIVIVGAERLGLATLHQLRGRVSRNGLKGYCFLFTKQKQTERLAQFCKTQDGFAIAQMDLQYRNSGDLLNGENQSGKQFNYIDLSSDEAIIQEAKDTL